MSGAAVLRGNTLLLPVFQSFVSTLSVFLSQAGNHSDPDFPALDSLASEYMFDDSCSPNERHYFKTNDQPLTLTLGFLHWFSG